MTKTVKEDEGEFLIVGLRKHWGPPEAAHIIHHSSFTIHHALFTGVDSAGSECGQRGRGYLDPQSFVDEA